MFYWHFNLQSAPLDVLVVMPGVKVFVDANLLDPERSSS